jgi:hypothetical protein
LELWLDAAVDVTETGQGVSSWLDQSGKGNHATQGGNTARPALLATGFRGGPGVEFDGTGEHLTVTDPADGGLDPGTGSFLCVVVGHFVSGSGTYDVWTGKSSSALADNWRAFRDNADHLRLFWGSDAQSYPASTATVADATDYVLGWGVDASSNDVIYIVNTAVPAVQRQTITVSGTGDNGADLFIGQDTAGNYTSNMVVAEQLFYKRAGGFTNLELTDLVNHLSAKYGF